MRFPLVGFDPLGTFGGFLVMSLDVAFVVVFCHNLIVSSHSSSTIRPCGACRGGHSGNKSLHPRVD